MPNRSVSRLPFAVLLVAGLVAASARAQPQRALGADQVTWNAAPDALVASFHEVATELADPDPTPLVRVYGDGRVHVHFPPYSRRAGDFETRLAPGALEALLLSLADALTEFDPEAVARRKETAVTEQAERALATGRSPTFFHVADPSIAHFELHLASYRRAGPPGLTAADVRRRVSWPALREDAERFAGIEALGKLYAAELALRGLAERAELAPVGEVAP